MPFDEQSHGFQLSLAPHFLQKKSIHTQNSPIPWAPNLDPMKSITAPPDNSFALSSFKLYL